jgi:ankyrin repeat protein
LRANYCNQEGGNEMKAISTSRKEIEVDKNGNTALHRLAIEVDDVHFKLLNPEEKNNPKFLETAAEVIKKDMGIILVRNNNGLTAQEVSKNQFFKELISKVKEAYLQVLKRKFNIPETFSDSFIEEVVNESHLKVLKKDGSSVNVPSIMIRIYEHLDRKGNSELHNAVLSNNENKIAALGELGVNPFIRNENGKLASDLCGDDQVLKNKILEQEANYIHKAVVSGNREMLKSSLYEGNVNGYKGRNTPLIDAIQFGGDQYSKVISDILAAGADINKVDTEGKTALHHAMISTPFSHEGRVIINNLLNDGADTNAKDNEGNSPLHYFMRSVSHAHEAVIKDQGKLEQVREDLKNPASPECAEELWHKEVNLKNSIKISPTYVSETHNILEDLKQHGVQKDAKNKKGEEPVDMIAHDGLITAITDILDAKKREAIQPSYSKGYTEMHNNLKNKTQLSQSSPIIYK